MNPQMDTSVDSLSSASYLCWPDNSIAAVFCLMLLLLWGLSFHLKEKHVRAEKVIPLPCILGYNIVLAYLRCSNSAVQHKTHSENSWNTKTKTKKPACTYLQKLTVHDSYICVFLQKVPTDQQDQPAEAKQCPLQFREHHASLHSTYLSPETLHRRRVQFWCLPLVPIGQTWNLASTHPHSSPSLPSLNFNDHQGRTAARQNSGTV